MISIVEGEIIGKEEGVIIVKVGGLGFKVFVLENASSELKEKQKITLFTHLVVRENILDLYGFSSKQELDFFKLLLSVSGIGPKGALNVLNQAGPTQLLSSVSSGDFSLLTSTPGIGEKTAQRIVLELKNKIKKISSFSQKMGKKSKNHDYEATEALMALGYKRREALEAISRIDSKIKSTEEKVKAALKNMAS